MISKIYDDDKNRGDKTNNLSLKEFASATLSKILSDSMYEKEFTDFVTNMVYKNSDIISYFVVLDNYSKLIQQIEG